MSLFGVRVASDPLPPIPASGSANGRDSGYVSEAERICSTLRVFRDQRCEIRMRIGGSGDEILGRILDVSQREFLIEDIRPRSALSLFRARTTFSFAARVDGLYAFAEKATVISREEERGLPFFRVALPASLLVQQRRRDARYRLPMRVSARGASVILPRDITLNGRITDISVGGLRAEFPIQGTLPDRNETVHHCRITIPNLLEVTSTAVIRHVRMDVQRRVFECGIELTEMPITDRRRLEQFVQSLAKISAGR
ncbi:MAG: flagellar brake protein [Pseudomonadales bacterium]|nr:flagellar brake protein [Pseudomonadales bacterium]MCP5184718.1 flagellar brake protein [Pseudomonadales bacterium]